MLPLHQFKAYIQQNALFSNDDQILLAVSGGRDSVLMAHLFKLAGYNFGIAHCNFNLRGEESVRDEHFVKMLGTTLGVPVYVKHFQTKAYANTHKISIQMAARDLRYHWFEELSNQEGYQRIALAQHQDDAIETVLLNLTRGTGIAGLHGILPKRGKLIRPLLFLTRTAINDLIDAENIDYVEDSSNLSANYARNKIRLKVIPQLKEINASLELTFQHNIQRFADTEQVLQQVVTELRNVMFRTEHDGIYLSIEKVKSLNPQKLLMFELLKPYHFSEAVIADLIQALDKQSGISFFSSSHQLTLNRDELIISPILSVEIGQHLLWHPTADKLETPNGTFSSIRLSKAAFDENYQIERDPCKAYLDTDQLIYPLIVRNRQPGDKFKPFGMKHYKKLSDFFIDEKVPLTRKDTVPILLNGNGEVIWVTGMRQDNRYKLDPATKNITILTFSAPYITNSKQS
ncbi:tRNA lysidine(34) synthetase TilS [Pedobacter gandavensis]|uniref:tRNA lysidine(34) synthetase TilS n=1 Tax=Pedobacter gandavensis TaxID=2679963 RepID=UPI002478BEC6|nr:tRNA lysidine(34) synthetase TilS [Pedobacter gandavensis]WGQ08260.1 tRNA lysidine(34) synthetase TilS [Pedobacter gandavensis]